jgi:hypothetical protein
MLLLLLGLIGLRASWMIRIAGYITTVLLLASSPFALAGTQDEIEHLLQYIENSGCEFERNGTVYDSKKARSHIERKYNYIESRVDETEDFIKYAATRSSMSGKKYQVTCNGKQQASAEWLHTELSKYRANPAAAAALELEERQAD